MFILKSKRQLVLDNISHFISSDNKNIRNALITIFLNYSIVFLDANDSEGRIQIISALADIIGKENDD